MDLSPPQIAGSSLGEYDAAFREINVTGTGSITSQDAANYLKRTQLPNEKLGQVWQLADYSKRGSLDRRGFFIALKGCALIQKGYEANVNNIHMDVGLPNMVSGAMSPAPPLADQWSIPQDERCKYDAIFQSLGPVGGKLPGDKVKPVLLNSGLPMNILGKIWELSDIDQDGQLDQGEMSVALHLVYRSLENDPLPSSLPLHIIPPAKRNLRRGSMSQIDGIGVGGSLPIGVPPPPTSGHRSRTASVTSNESIGLGMSPQIINQLERRTSLASIGQRSLTGTPISMLNPPVVPPSPWIVHKGKYEQAFAAADLDQDGLVTGNDIKQSFMMSGLAQNYLAHIWSLVDLNHNGKLNMEQYALAMHLIEQKREYNVEPPPTLTPDLVPPSFRPNPAGMTDISTSTHEPECVQNESRDLVQSRKELETVLDEKRTVESAVIQLQADSTVKNSEIKNLEIESQTLENTVKQLERQKQEAGKRLFDLDSQKDSLQATLNDLLAKIDLEQHEINALKDDVELTHSTAKNQEEELNRKRNELQMLRNEESKLEVNLQMQKANLDTVAQQTGATERKIGTTEANMKQLLEQTSHMEETLSVLEEIMANENVEKLRNEEKKLLAPIRKLDLPYVAVEQHTNLYPRLSNHVQHNNNDDPFKQVDDPFASSGPVAADPFASSDPFGSDPFAATPANDPFANNNAFQADPFGGPAAPVQGVKKPPPRPAPPKSKTPDSNFAQTSGDPFADATSDPFASLPTPTNNTANDGFANFANFANFS